MSRQNKSLIKLAAIATGLATSLIALPSLGDDYHYVNMLVGDRAAGLGGAYTAISDDATGLFYNPAGIVYSPGSSLSGSMNSYQATNTSYKKVLGGTYDWDRSSSSLLPNFFGIVQPLGSGVIGLSYAVPNSIEEDQDQEFKNIATSLGTAKSFFINFNNSDNTYNFGPSYARKINNEISIGATLYFHYRHQQRISNTILLYTDDRLWSNDYYELEEFGLKPVLGVMWSPTEQLALGVTLRKVNIFDSTTTVHQACLGANAGSYTAGSLCYTGDVVNHQVIVSDEENKYPLSVAFGGTWFASNALLVSADITYYEAVGAGANKRDSVINFAVGSEYYLSPRLALRAGFYSDFANTPDLQQNFTAYNQHEHIDLYGISFSISHFTRNSSLSFGFNYSMGSGEAQIISGDPTLQDADMETFGIFLAASYAY